VENEQDPVAPEIKIDTVCAGAVDLALASARDLAGGDVGEHLGVRAESDRMVTHMIEALLPGYTGWYWAVTVGRAPGFAPTVAEIVLLPGSDSILALPWVPWSERLQPGDLSPGDLLPAVADDPRLVPAYLDSSDADPLGAEHEVAFELGLGRVRVLSRDARLDAAERWFDGTGGPDTPMARQAPAQCGSCGFLIQVSGSLRAAFGICANEITETDGRVVSVEHGCGAHSEAGLSALSEDHFLTDRGQVFEDELYDAYAIDYRAPDTAQLDGNPQPTVAPDLLADIQPAADTEPAPEAELVSEPELASEAELAPEAELVSEPDLALEPEPIPATADVLSDLGVDLEL
jgi:hypothetical protein